MNESIAYITDIHLDEEFPVTLGAVNPIEHDDNMRNNWKIILNDIESRGIRKIIFGGDIGKSSSNEWFFQSLLKFDIDLVLGNHDSYATVIKYFDKSVDAEQNELFYTKKNDYYKYIFLDSSAGEISQNQFTWLKRELISEKDVVIFIHHPILPISAEVDKQFALKGRHLIENELLGIKSKVTIFSGHYHLEDKKTKENIVQYITPASSYQVEKITDEIRVHKDSFGYRIIEFDKTEMKSNVILF
ncbi:metallophosphoesterase [uncultured Croceitalea sp.]|uniref:metallophosphoesterase family protein n=1 Tax=uncultured Croceitalea sp. TaxID=1798908 RepID=UPI0033063634